MEKRHYPTTLLAAAGLMAVCSCVNEPLPAGGFGKGYIEPVVSCAGEMTKSPGASGSRYIGCYTMEGPGDDTLYLSVFEYDNTDRPSGLMENNPRTKVAEVTTNSINQTGQQFTINAWLESANRHIPSQDGDGHVYIHSDHTNWHIMNNVTVERNATKWFYTDGNNYPWRNQVATNFWSVYPVTVPGLSINYPSGTNGLDNPSDDDQKKLSFSYSLPVTGGPTSPHDAQNQQDICFAYNTKTWSEGSDNKINIEFRHALSAVYFSDAGVTSDIIIEQIGFDNIWSSGDCNVVLKNDNPDFKWNNLSALNNYMQDYYSTDFSDNVIQIDTCTKVYMMIPQELDTSARLRVKFRLSDNSAVEKTVNISRDRNNAQIKWEHGKKYLYRISADKINFDYTLSVDSTIVHFPPVFASQVSKYLKIDSYKIKKGSTDTIPVFWSLVKYSIDRGNTWQNYDWQSTGPTVIDWTRPEFFKYGFGGEGEQGSWFSVQPHQATPQYVYTSYTNALRSNGTRGSSASPWDLSTHTASGDNCNMSTANCYIVDRAGTYKLPLVYGPSIYDGQTIASAYTSACAGEGNVFVNHLGNPIEDPYIYQNTGCGTANIKDAVLLYQDAEGIISGVELCDSNHYLKFNVESANLQQCNAIVAVRDNSDRIMWSWHIWVTAEDYSITRKLGSTDFALMNIGTVRPAKETRYQRREAVVVFRQDESGLLDTLTIVQMPLTIPEYETCPTYQWGRKDPMLRALNPVGESHCYTTDGTDVGTYRFAVSNSNVSTSTAIQHPHIIYAGNPADSTEWNSGSHLRILWNNQSNPNLEPSDVVKTVYDPSPVGYCVPIFNAAFGLLTNVSAVTYESYDPAEFNGIFIDKGFNAVCSPGDTLFFPFSGYRICGGGYAGGFGEIGQWWTADRLTYDNPLCFAIYKYVEEYNGPYIIRRSFWSKAANAYAVRPMKYTPSTTGGIGTSQTFNDYTDKGNKNVTF